MENNEFLTYIVGGRLGDFIYGLYVVMMKYRETGKKGVVYLSDRKEWKCHPMSRSMEDTYAELRPLVMHQEYISEFKLWTKSTGEGRKTFDYNLNEWRNHCSRVNWLTMLQQVYGLENYRGPWLVSPEKEGTRFNLMVHRSLIRANADFPWERLLKNVPSAFLTSDMNEYTNFPWKNLLTCTLCKDICEMVACIDACTFFVGNQSAPISIAAALGKPFLAVLSNTPMNVDTLMYIHREYAYKGEFWYLNQDNMMIPSELNILAANFVRLEVSIGEALDKLSILKLKERAIKENRHVQNEIAAIEPDLKIYVERCRKLYIVLEYVNKRLWDLCEWSRHGALENSNDYIMKENDARFRIKNKINQVCRSFLREQKSYQQRWVKATVVLVCEKTEAFLRFLSTYHDVVWIDLNCLSDQERSSLVELASVDPGIRMVEGMPPGGGDNKIADTFVVGERITGSNGKIVDVPDAFLQALVEVCEGAKTG